MATREERARVLQEEEFKANRELTVENSNLREANKSLRCGPLILGSESIV